MRTTLADSARENAQLAAELVKARGERESAEKGLRTRIGDLEELLHHSNIKLKGTNADGVKTQRFEIYNKNSARLEHKWNAGGLKQFRYFLIVWFSKFDNFLNFKNSVVESTLKAASQDILLKKELWFR